MIDFNNVIFVARPDTWYDSGTIAILDSKISTDELLKDCTAMFIGMRDNSLDGEYCCLTEFDWIDKTTRKCLNSNIPYIPCSSQKDGILHDLDTNKNYNILENKEI